jgi:hypothetical protein
LFVKTCQLNTFSRFLSIPKLNLSNIEDVSACFQYTATKITSKHLDALLLAGQTMQLNVVESYEAIKGENDGESKHTIAVKGNCAKIPDILEGEDSGLLCIILCKM